MGDIVERLSGYNPPDRVLDQYRREAQDISDALAEIKRLRTIEAEWMSLSQDDGKLEREIERLRDVRDSWCAAYTKARDQRDALKVALDEIHVAAKDWLAVGGQYTTRTAAALADAIDSAALASVPAADVVPSSTPQQKEPLPFGRKCGRCGKECWMPEPALTTAFYCSIACASC